MYGIFFITNENKSVFSKTSTILNILLGTFFTLKSVPNLKTKVPEKFVESGKAFTRHKKKILYNFLKNALNRPHLEFLRVSNL